MGGVDISLVLSAAMLTDRVIEEKIGRRVEGLRE